MHGLSYFQIDEEEGNSFVITCFWFNWFGVEEEPLILLTTSLVYFFVRQTLSSILCCCWQEKPDVRALSLGIIHDFSREELAHFPGLTFLGGEMMNFVGDLKDSLLDLRWLSWHHCPLNLRATNLCPVNLVVLDLSFSDITHEWAGWSQIKVPTHLAHVRFKFY